MDDNLKDQRQYADQYRYEIAGRLFEGTLEVNDNELVKYANFRITQSSDRPEMWLIKSEDLDYIEGFIPSRFPSTLHLLIYLEFFVRDGLRLDILEGVSP